MKATLHRFLKEEEEPMEQFSILQVIVSTEGQEPHHKYLNFGKFPDIRLCDDLAASTLFNRVSDAENHGKKFLEKLQEPGDPLAGFFIKGLEGVGVSVRIIHYAGEYATSMAATVEHVGIVTISRNKK